MQQHKRKGTIPMTLSLAPDLVAQIDAARGLQPWRQWAIEAINAKLAKGGKQ